MKKTSLLSSIAFSALIIAPLSANADPASLGLDVSANVGFVSQYAFRGISQSDENIALQGGFDAAHDSGLYAGVWGSSVDFNDGDEAQAEVDLYGGYSGSINNINYDIGVIYYAYPGADSSLDYDFVEGSVAVGYDFDLFSASASFNYSPEYFADSGDAQYYAVNADVPLPKDFTLSGHVGHQVIDDGASFGIGEDDYTDWSVGLGYSFAGFDLSLQYVDTDLDEPGECADGCEERIIFGVSKSF